MKDMRPVVDRAVAGDANALDEVVLAVQDDIYNLCLRMLGRRADAEDACQEILIQIITHLAQWRGEASLRTWSWRIAGRYLNRMRRTAKEEMVSFDLMEELIAVGQSNPALPQASEAELELLQEELKLSCTHAMLLALERDQRIAWILAEIFELDSNEAADVLDIDAATHRKRVSRAREKLGAWMQAHCGLVRPDNPCSCRRQIPVGIDIGVIDPSSLEFATHPTRKAGRLQREFSRLDDADQMKVAAYVLCSHPDYKAPQRLHAKIRELVSSGSLKLFK
jgi:RNA polymerase sigma factor (sigma-70 family)